MKTMKQIPWYKNAVFYEVYVRAFYDSNADGHGDIAGLTQKLDYLKGLGVDCIWLLPIYPSPLKDDGYDIADYTHILPTYGTLEDFKILLDEVHGRGMRLITDLVLNHTSDQHPWFQAARADRSSPYRDYFVWSDDDQKYGDARIIFLDTEKSNWTWDEQAGQYFWHRFFASQPDLNYDNPKVEEEMLNVVKYWLDMGIDGFRVDAVTYLIEREGTNCENLPETHAYLKKLRRFVDEHYTDKILLCEANQLPQDVVEYFGNGDEFNLGFNFPVMPRIFKALCKEDATDIINILNQTPPLPDGCQWCTFLRNHDELTLEMASEEERQWMWQVYAPDARMRLNQGIRRRLAPLLDNDRRKIELAFALLFSLPGSPFLYYGDEIGMGDNIWLDDRNGVRTPMQWNKGMHAGFSSAPPERGISSLYAPILSDPIYEPEKVNVEDQIHNPASLFNTIKQLIRIRKEHYAFGAGTLVWADVQEKSVLAFYRGYEEQRILVISNLSGSVQPVQIALKEKLFSTAVELTSGEPITATSGNAIKLVLKPYQYLWIQLS